jgi:ferredoxin-NADP reductase
MSSIPALFALPFVKKEQLTNDVYSFYFDRVSHPFSFLPGQYLRMILPHENPDERGTSRFFTIASSPTDHENLMFTIRILQSTFKHALLGLLPGQNVQFWGPIGQFVLHEEAKNPLVFLAGGIGLTPYHCMMTYAYERSLQTPMILFVSFKTVDDMVFYDEFMKLVSANHNLRVVYTMTHPEESQSWTGERGRISAEMLKKYVLSPEICTFYISGPGTMVEETEKFLHEMKIPTNQIILEKFPGY